MLRPAQVCVRQTAAYKCTRTYGVGGALQADNLDALVLPTCVFLIVPALGGYPIVSVPLDISAVDDARNKYCI